MLWNSCDLIPGTGIWNTYTRTYGKVKSTSSHDEATIPGLALLLWTTRKLNKIHETPIFRHWTSASQGCGSREKGSDVWAQWSPGFPPRASFQPAVLTAVWRSWEGSPSASRDVCPPQSHRGSSLERPGTWVNTLWSLCWNSWLLNKRLDSLLLYGAWQILSADLGSRDWSSRRLSWKELEKLGRREQLTWRVPEISRMPPESLLGCCDGEYHVST